MSPTTVGNFDQLGKQTIVTGRLAASAADQQDIQELRRKESILQIARERFSVARDAENRRRDEMLLDLKFRCGEQWDEDVKRARDAQGRPCLTINRIPGFLKHVLNNMRQARPEIKVDPVGDGADEELAEIKQGIIRHIQVSSRADIAYDTAFECMATMGLGFVRVLDGWADESSFDKDLFIEWVPNVFTIYFDPGARKPDWSDAKYCFVVEDLSVAEFRFRYPDAASVGLDDFQSTGDHQANWRPGGKIRVAEYFYIEEIDDTLCELADGTKVLFSQLPEKHATIQRMRKKVILQVKWAKMNGLGIMQERVWKGKYIPIIPFIGNQVDLDGDLQLIGMVRYAREAQRMFNYMYSCFVESVALAPKAPFIAEFDQIQEFRQIWDRANIDILAVLPYRAKSADGNLVPAPHRNQAEPPIQAFVEGLKLADQNLKSVFSIYEASLGQKGPQESGIAINSRKVESDVATYDWIDNFNRGVHYLGVVLDDLLQYYYNTPGRIMQLVGDDELRRPVTLNQEHDVEGQTKKYDLSQGTYSITFSTGPSHATRRQEAAQSMLELAKVYPPLMQVAGPMIVKEMDWPGKDAIAAQLEKAMPPELRQQDENAEKPPVPPEAQQMMAQLQQQNQQLTEALNQASSQQETERAKEEWATLRTQMHEENALAIATLKTGSDEAKLLANELFGEFRRVAALFQSLVQQPGQSPAPTSSAPASAAPSPAVAPAPPSSPLPIGDGNTPGGVGTAE